MENINCDFIVYFENEPIAVFSSYYRARKFVHYLKKFSFYDDPNIFIRRTLL